MVAVSQPKRSWGSLANSSSVSERMLADIDITAKGITTNVTKGASSNIVNLSENKDERSLVLENCSNFTVNCKCI